MATYVKRGDTWQARIRLTGRKPESANFPTKAAAKRWADERERGLRLDVHAVKNTLTVRDLFDKYSEEISPRKAGAEWEAHRLALYGRLIGDKRLDEIDVVALSALRDARMKEVSGSTVVRDFHLLSHVFNVAIKEFKWLTANPLKDVWRPKENDPRERRISDREIEQLRQVSGYLPDEPPVTETARVQAALEFAVETGMRSGEICKLKRENLYVSERYVHLPAEICKTRKKRDVPLSPRALALLEQVGALGFNPVFGLADASRDALFRKTVSKTTIENLTFHDSRHEAITRLAKKLDVLDLARMVGHANIKQLMTYYNESAANMATRL